MRYKADKPLVVLFGAMIFAFIYMANPSSTPVVVSNDGFTKVGVTLDGTALTFSANCYAVTMDIHEIQALSIENGLNGVIDVRPLTHDMMHEVLDSFGIAVLEIQIYAFENGIWKAKTFLQQGNKILDIDTRPSDAVGIAVRTGAPVYFDTQLLESRGVKTC